MKEEIRSTTKYNMFEVHEFNRDVKKTKKLEESMKRHGWIPAYPMHVERNGHGKLKIKAGHHRFTAAVNLGIPVKYVISNDTSSINELEESTTPWTIRDFLLSNCRLGKAPYTAVRRFQEMTGIPLSQCISMLKGDAAGSCNHGNAFKAGTYQIGDTGHAYAVADVVIELKKLGVDFAAQNQFVSALSRALFVDAFDARVFIDRVDVNRGLMVRQSSSAEYLNLIEKVYNHGSKKNRLPIAFLANESARERNAVKTKK